MTTSISRQDLYRRVALVLGYAIFIVLKEFSGLTFIPWGDNFATFVLLVLAVVGVTFCAYKAADFLAERFVRKEPSV